MQDDNEKARNQTGTETTRTTRLVAVVRGLVGTVDRDVEVLGLGLAEDGQLDVELSKVRAGDFLVELLGEHVDAKREVIGASPERDLGKDLVRERTRHDKRRVTSRASEVDKTALGEEDDVTAVGHGEAVDLGLDVDNFLGIGLQPRDVDFDIKVADAVMMRIN